MERKSAHNVCERDVLFICFPLATIILLLPILFSIISDGCS